MSDFTIKLRRQRGLCPGCGETPAVGRKKCFACLQKTRRTWRHIVPTKTVVEVRFGSSPPLRLTWEQFADLANCCKELSERTTETNARYNSVSIQISHE